MAKTQAQLKRLDVYKNASHLQGPYPYDGTNGGVTAKHPTIYLLTKLGELPSYVDRDLIFVPTEYADGALTLKHLYPPPGTKGKAGPMFGGNYAIDNSAVPKVYAILDRYETLAEYRMLSV